MTELEIREKLAYIDLMLTQNRQALADIDLKRAQYDRTRQEMGWAPWQVVATVVAASAAVFTAGGAVVGLLVANFHR